MGLSILSSCALVLAVLGPTANPENQFRQFWGMQFDVAERCVKAGFNLLTSAKDPNEAGEFARWLPFCETNGVDFAPMLLKFYKNDKVDGKTLKERYPRVDAAGRPRKGAGADATTAGDYLAAKADRWGRDYARRYGRHKELIGFMTSSEVRDTSFPSFTPAMTSAWLRVGGQLPVPKDLCSRWGVERKSCPDFPADGVVPDEDPILNWYRWWWKTGDGWNDYQTRVAAALQRAFDRPIFTYYDPDVRVPPLWGSGGEVSHTGTWIYPYPEPAMADYIVSEEQAMARGNPGRGLITGIQGISYRSKLAPRQEKVENPPAWLAEQEDAVYITTPPDLLREAFWFLFARRLDGLDTHGQGSVFGPASYKGGYRFTNAAIEGTFADLFLNVANPLGPLFKALPERPPEVAVLESFTSTIYLGRHSWGWGDETGTLLTLANLAPQVLYEEDLVRAGVPASVKVLLIHDCVALSRTSVLQVRAFQDRGGLVVGSERTLPAITPDLELPTFVRKDRLAEDHAAIRRAAAEIKRAVAGRFEPLADSDRADIIVRTRSYGSADYVFAINDRRGAGDYVGQWGHVYEKGLPNEGKVFVRRTCGAVYDLVRHQALPFETKDSQTAVEVEYETSDGRLLAFLEKPLAPLSVQWDEQGVRVTSPDRKVMIPVELRADGGKPYFGVLSDGTFVPAAFKTAGASEVTVRNLMDGTLVRCAFKGTDPSARGTVPVLERGTVPVLERGSVPVLVAARRAFRRELADPATRAEAIRRGLESADPVMRRAAKYARDGGRRLVRFPFHRDNVARSQDKSNDHSMTVVSKIDLPKTGWSFVTDPDDCLFDGETALFKSPDGWSKAATVEIGKYWEDQTAPGYDGCAWYRLRFTLPEKSAVCDSLELCFDGVDEEAWVWLNGTYVGQHAEGTGGYAQPFRFGVGDEARWGTENELVVRVSDTTGAGGIWKGVRIEVLKFE